jgi:hypothetical protein
VRKSRSAVVLMLATSLVLAACDRRSEASTPVASTPEVTPSVDGWIALFDGSSTAALRGYGQDSLPPSWVVDNGELRTVPGAGVDLITRDTFTDFELEFEWRVSPGGNSGVLYRVVENDSPSWTSGPEYQVLDDAGHADGQDPRTSAASLYGLIAPNGEKRLEPVGSFNTGRIVVDDGRVDHWLNGSRVLGYEWDGADVRSLVGASKFRDLPVFMSSETGGVVLQHHGEEVWFRNVRIRRLD